MRQALTRISTSLPRKTCQAGQGRANVKADAVSVLNVFVLLFFLFSSFWQNLKWKYNIRYGRYSRTQREISQQAQQELDRAMI